MSCHELLGFMSPSLASEILDFAYATDKPLYRATLASVAEAKKVRVVFYEKKPRAERHREMLEMLSRPRMEAVSANLIRGWLLKSESTMLGDFLDKMQIPHQKGVVEKFPEDVDEAKLTEAVNDLLSKYPREKVVIYLNAFLSTNETVWPSLESMLQKDERLQLA